TWVAHCRLCVYHKGITSFVINSIKLRIYARDIGIALAIIVKTLSSAISHLSILFTPFVCCQFAQEARDRSLCNPKHNL
ncbi:MAG: hypothetical protein AAFY16_07535, partial [Cyanobacteria bacterium J06642_3]